MPFSEGRITLGPFGLGGGPFGAQFGPGIRVHTFGGGPRQRRPQQAGNNRQGNFSVLYQLLPILLLIAFTIIPNLFSTSTPVTPPPSFSFELKDPYTVQRVTPQHSIPYYMKQADASSLSNSKLRQLDQKAEVTYVRGLRDMCQAEYDVRQQKLVDAQGWFGQITDKEAWEEARTMRLASCERLRGLGYRPEVY